MGPTTCQLLPGTPCRPPAPPTPRSEALALSLSNSGTGPSAQLGRSVNIILWLQQGRSLSILGIVSRDAMVRASAIRCWAFQPGDCMCTGDASGAFWVRYFASALSADASEDGR